MPITALYASLLALLFLLLSFRVIAQRRAARVELGHGDSHQLLRRIRVHANFAEYVPFALVLIGLAESLKAPGGLVHTLGFVLLLARLIHAYGLSQTPHILKLRVLGMTLTFAVIAVAALACFTLGLLQSLV
jgi:uncharacterized membrane protein YecN with MAPEG domain